MDVVSPSSAGASSAAGAVAADFLYSPEAGAEEDPHEHTALPSSTFGAFPTRGPLRLVEPDPIPPVPPLPGREAPQGTRIEGERGAGVAGTGGGAAVTRAPTVGVTALRSQVAALQKEVQRLQEERDARERREQEDDGDALPVYEEAARPSS